MASLQTVRNFFTELYPKPSKKLQSEFEKVCESSNLEDSFLQFLEKVLRVSRDKDKSFDDNLQMFKRIRLELKTTTLKKTTVPGFIITNTLDMPSNRGYIWKNIKYYGKKPPAEGPIVLFEPRKGKTFIHVWETNHYKVYEKLKGNKFQTLIKTEKIEKEEPKKTTNITPNKYSALFMDDSDSD